MKNLAKVKDWLCLLPLNEEHSFKENIAVWHGKANVNSVLNQLTTAQDMILVANSFEFSSSKQGFKHWRDIHDTYFRNAKGFPKNVKSVSTWIDMLPKPVRRRFVQNMVAQHGEEKTSERLERKCFVEDMNRADRTFVWDKTPEGSLYWSRVYEKIFNKQFMRL